MYKDIDYPFNGERGLAEVQLNPALVPVIPSN